MCGCSEEFVHGLALPRHPVTGVEDLRRPEAIWQFAWNAGSQRIKVNELALVVNPARLRSQDQLHIHLLRLRNDARSRLTVDIVKRVATLDGVWNVAEVIAKAQGLADYGVLVSSDLAGGYLVSVTSGSPEEAFTDWRCR